ncbi:MAG: bifunctional nuclease family protein [Bacteroidetes bacterium]|nr:bifunctional nuclease family protein [Bacteroidota bacterium]MDA1334074.1 bifunctional nuclease family protein [Bacteroidota bacterium]
MDLIQVDIIGLSTSPSSGGAYALVLGEVDGNRRLPIIIGAFEAQAIALELEKIQPPRPMTHDLIRDLFDSVSADVTDILIDELREGTFFAKIRYIVGGAEAQLDCRPSDAVALAVRVGAPIYVSVSVLDEAGIPTEEEESLTSVESSETEVEADPEPAEEQPRSPLEQLEEDLAGAIADEDYELAAKLRDDITRLNSEQN